MRPWPGLALAALLAGCAPAPKLPSAPIPLAAPIRVAAAPVPMDPADPRHEQLGAFAYAGGLDLTTTDTSRFHGLSDLKVWPDGRFLAEGDEGDQVEGRLKLDARGRLADVTDVRIHALRGEDGVELRSKGTRFSDAEGVAEFPNGDRLVSFEQNDRVLLYPKGGGAPHEVPKPDIAWKFNQGMEGLDLDPAAGPDAYRVGIEATGQTFTCRLSGSCVAGVQVAQTDGYEISGLAVLSGGRTAYLLRSFDPVRGNRIILRITGPDGATLDELRIARPLTVDNLEGVAAVPGKGGALRFYLIADDNFGTYNGLPTGQRTLLLAFDWRPAPGARR